MPKEISGCYNCSQRRIKCDQTRPQCVKCLAKGLECPGYGIRYRFNNGVASRGKLTGRTLPAEQNLSSHGNAACSPASASPRVLLWPDGSTTHSKTQSPGPKATTGVSADSTLQANQPYSHSYEHLEAFANAFAIPEVTGELRAVVDEGYVEFTNRFNNDFTHTPETSVTTACPLLCNSASPAVPCTPMVHSSLSRIGPQSRELFAHFSSSVAPVMVVLDGRFNGYRDLILPLACEDSLVGKAVSVVSMYHLASRRPEMQVQADAGFQAVIAQLRERTSWRPNLLDISAWTTIVVLLTGETITGGTNFPSLFKMLQHLAEADSKSGHDSVMHSFLREQTRMMTLFAQPLLGETAGIMTLGRHQPDTYFDFISNAAVFFPQLSSQIDMYKSAIRRACNLYLARVTRGSPHSETVADLEVLKTLCERIHPSNPGHHTLVWVYFVAAAESSTLGHRQFFTLRLQEVFSRTRFNNIPAALMALDELWRVQHERRWTEMLPEVLPVFII